MKTWNSAELVELEISATAEGGKNIEQVDKFWTDKNTGDLYASYASGGSAKGDEFEVIPEILEFKGIRLIIGYTFTSSGEIIATGKTSHCFLTTEGRPIALKRQFPEFDAVLKSLVKVKFDFLE